MNQIFRLKDIMYGVRKHLTVIIGMTLGGLLVGIMISVVQSFSASNTVSYQVFSSFSVATSNDTGMYVSGMTFPGNGDFDLASELVDPISYICRSEKVCAEVINRLNLIGVKTKTLQNALALKQYGETSIVEITLRWKDADEGILILNTVMEILSDAIREVLNIGEIETIEGPMAVPITIDVGVKVVLLLTGIGFILGMLYCFAQLYMHPTLIEIKDVGELFGINLLSSISEEPSFSVFMAENLITNRQDMPVTMRESYMALAHILLHQVDEDHFSLFVTSASRGEGKTTVVSNLGMELAALDKRVLLIDFDLTSPALGSFFLDEIDYMHTVNAVYFDDTSVQEAIIRINENLYLLPARLDKRHMGVDRFAKKLVAQMETEFDVVLIDTAPVGESSETLYFSNVSNSAMFVIRYDYTPCDVIEESIEKLQKTSTVIHGAVVNRVPHLGFTGNAWEGGGKQKKEKKKRNENNTGLAGRRRGSAEEKPKKVASKHKTEHDDDLMENMITKAPASKKPAAQKRRNQPMQHDDQDDEELMQNEIVIKAPASKKPAAQKRRDQLMESGDEDDDELMDDEIVTKAPVSKKPAAQKRRDRLMESSDEDDDELMEDEIVTKASASKKPATQKRRDQLMESDDEDDDELMEDEIVTKASASKKSAAQKRRDQLMRRDDEDDDELMEENETVTKAPASKEPTVRKRRSRQLMQHDDEDDDDVLTEAPARKKAEAEESDENAPARRKAWRLTKSNQNDDPEPAPKKQGASKKRKKSSASKKHASWLDDDDWDLDQDEAEDDDLWDDDDDF